MGKGVAIGFYRKTLNPKRSRHQSKPPISSSPKDLKITITTIWVSAGKTGYAERSNRLNMTRVHRKKGGPFREREFEGKIFLFCYMQAICCGFSLLLAVGPQSHAQLTCSSTTNLTLHSQF